MAHLWRGFILLVYVYVWLSHGGLVNPQCSYVFGTLMIGLYIRSLCMFVAHSWEMYVQSVCICLAHSSLDFILTGYVCVCHIGSRVIHSQFMYEFVTFMVEFHIHSLRTSYIHDEFVYWQCRD